MKLVAEYSFWHYRGSNCVGSPKSSEDCIVEGSAVTDAGGGLPSLPGLTPSMGGDSSQDQ